MALEQELQAEVMRYRQWAQLIPQEERSGEWECDYPDWNQLYATVLDFIESKPLIAWTPEEWEAVLYAIARDNEMQFLVESIGEEHPQMLAPLTAAALEHREPNATWQLALELTRADPLSTELEGLLLRMAVDADEYVRRRALTELARRNSPQTEGLALAAWHQPHEAQQWARMAALWSLHQIQSPLLNELLTEAEADPRPYLSGYAQRMRRAEVDE